MTFLSALRKVKSGGPPVVDIALGALWLVLFQLAAVHSWRDPGSFFYDSEKAFKPIYSATRESEADTFIIESSATSHHPYIQTEKHPDSSSFDGNNTSRICAGIPTKGREKEQFLPRTIASLVDTLSPEERKSLHIIVLIVEDEPETNPAFGQYWLSNMADEVLIYSTVPKYLSQDNYRYIDRNKPNKEAGRNEHVQLDYATLIEACQQQEPDYFLLVEDDIIASRNWLARLNTALQQVEASPSPNDWIYLRLFYTEFYLGWNGEEWNVYLLRVLFVYGLVAGIITLGRTLWGRLTRKQSPYSMISVVRFHLWFVAFTVLFFMAGRVTVTPKSQGIHEMNNYGCCAQGLAFPTQQLDMLKDRLRAPPHDDAGDSFIEMMAEEMHLNRWAMEPSVFQHVGVRGSSAKGGRRKKVWSYGFEMSKSLYEF